MSDLNALWARAQELLPGLRCPFHARGVPSRECPGREYHVGPDLALLLKAMREAGWVYSGEFRGLVVYWEFWRTGCMDFADGPDELTAALLAAVKALEAEKKGAIDGD